MRHGELHSVADVPGVNWTRNGERKHPVKPRVEDMSGTPKAWLTRQKHASADGLRQLSTHPRLPGSSWNFDGDPTGIVIVRR
jgi:hypothetical protein